MPNGQRTHVLQEPSSTAQQPMKRFTPAAVRELMPRVRDEEEECFRLNQRKCSEAIELDCSQRRWETTYAVPDTDEYDIHVLEAVYKRLVQWLVDEKFDVQPESTRPRSFTVSWDPAVTLASITEIEKADQQSNAMIRLRTIQRARGTNAYFSRRYSDAASKNGAQLPPNATRDQAQVRQQPTQQQQYQYQPQQQYYASTPTMSPLPQTLPQSFYMPAVRSSEDTTAIFGQHEPTSQIPMHQMQSAAMSASPSDASALYHHWLETATRQAAQMMAEQTWYPPNAGSAQQTNRQQQPKQQGQTVKQPLVATPINQDHQASLGDVVRSFGATEANETEAAVSSDNNDQGTTDVEDQDNGDETSPQNAQIVQNDVVQDYLTEEDAPDGASSEKPPRKQSPFAAHPMSK